MPIRVRLALVAVAVTSAVFGISAWLFAGSFERGLVDSIDEGLRNQSETFVRYVEGRDGDVVLDDAGDSFVTSADVVAQVLTSDGRVVAATREAGVRPVLGRDEVRAAVDVPLFADVSSAEEGEPFRLLAAPAATSSGTRVAVMGASLEATERSVARVHRALVVGGLLAVVLAGIGGWLLAGAALLPVERMRRKAAAISTDDLGAELDVPGGRDELSALASTMNDLLARLQGALAQQRTLVGDAGHELRTPLAVLRAELELANRPDRSIDELRDAIEHAADETDRLIELTDELLFLARDDAGGLTARRRPIALREVIDAAVTRHSASGTERGVRVVAEHHVEESIPLDVGLVARALDNLLVNALRHAPHGTTVRVTSERRGDTAMISVLDDGPGFPSEFLPHAFERFRRADDGRARADGGAGLGLAIVRAVAEAHDGTARAENRPGHGAIVTMTLHV